jgi:hypothetical protein
MCGVAAVRPYEDSDRRYSGFVGHVCGAESVPIKPERKFSELAAAYPPEVRQLARAARSLLRKLLPKCEESVDAHGPYVSYGYGPGYRGMVCSLILSKKGVKLGMLGSVPDPRGLLQGEGKRWRHIVLEEPTDLRRPGVDEIVKAAYRAWRAGP